MNFKLLLIALAIPVTSYAQTIQPRIPIGARTKRTDSSKVRIAKSLRQIADARILDYRQKFTDWQHASDTVGYFRGNKEKLNLKVADAKKMADYAEIDAIAAAADTASQLPVIQFFGVASLSGGTDFLSSITSSGRLQAQINFSNRLSVGLGANLLFANPGRTKKDSIDMNSLNFPETGNFGLLFTPSYRIPLGKLGDSNTHSLAIQFDYAYRRVSIDSPSIGFKVINYNVGIPYTFEHYSGSDTLTFTLMPYFNLFNIPSEDVRNFKSFVNDSLFLPTSNSARLASWGVKLTMQYNSLVFFADMRHNFNTSGFSDGNPLKGTLFNIGFATLFKIKSF